MNIKKIALGFSLVLSSNIVLAGGGQAVNCRMENTGYQNVYEGQVSCLASMRNGRLVKLEDYIFPTVHSSVTINRLVGNEFLNCTAKVPFSHVQPITKEVCDYTPYVNVSARQYSEGEAVFEISANDKDGHIQSRDVRINGASVSSHSDSIQVYGAVGETFYLTITVTDNDGYSSSSSAGITIKRFGSINPL
ncbi:MULTISPECIES: hypothetical protein [Pseudoalteromonas]|uniref:Uncharacterized protein n=1 Tax=Pseudoalteromonas luteoviolacea (strain 2ta16) TaxID=1353533 RepID=V4HVH6_PSEL2|nr:MULTISPECIES: hypothetical protein [Pseudoalteromonas]ESP94800.1 hypothetical protein PL2TA16_00800 [Pseudoalteromonas luteoviolacea 2ta16]KZN43334.1 hypothetical protein N483_08555 [Pseudoalteromonas luteoviolacea NCIMB 1944]MCG7547373.1 hypothetical protein [Pseudoalteromonas sp. Of7M-16]